MTDHLTKTLAEALRTVHALISEAAGTGFNCHDGDWAGRLFASQGASFDALKRFDAAQQAAGEQALPPLPEREYGINEAPIGMKNANAWAWASGATRGYADALAAQTAQPRQPMTLGTKFLHQEIAREMADFVTPREAQQVSQPVAAPEAAGEQALRAPYGYCPICGAKGRTRERRPNGNDTCEAGHTYPSSQATHLYANIEQARAAQAAQPLPQPSNPGPGIDTLVEVHSLASRPQPLPESATRTTLVRDELRFLTRYTPTRDGEMEPWDGGNWLDEGEVRAALTQPAPEAQQAEPVAWREHVEQRLNDWRQRKMNRSGDHLGLDDFMDKESLDDLIDYVCDEWSEPQAATKPEPQQPAQGVATRQVVPLSPAIVTRLCKIYAPDERRAFARAVERACAEAWGVKLAGEFTVRTGGGEAP